MTLHPNSTFLSLIVRGPFPSCSLVQFILFPTVTRNQNLQRAGIYKRREYFGARAISASMALKRISTSSQEQQQQQWNQINIPDLH
jgi:hypothetical protein